MVQVVGAAERERDRHTRAAERRGKCLALRPEVDSEQAGRTSALKADEFAVCAGAVDHGSARINQQAAIVHKRADSYR